MSDLPPRHQPQPDDFNLDRCIESLIQFGCDGPQSLQDKVQMMREFQRVTRQIPGWPTDGPG
jgi:hypothetical protein